VSEDRARPYADPYVAGAALGLVLLVVGLRRASRPLRLGGFFIQRLSQGGDGPVAQA